MLEYFLVKHRSVKTLGLAILASTMTACGGTGQDDPQATQISLNAISGRAVDGYVARATVFADTNNNSRRDAWEPFAFTDNQGYFSYNPLTQTGYCADDADAELTQYCLQVPARDDSWVLRIDSGYDVLTGEPLLGQMSRRVPAGAMDAGGGVMVSPLTTLVAHLQSESERDHVLSALGLDNGDLDVDYLNSDGANGVDARLLNTALRVHKTVTVIAENLTNRYDAIGNELNTPNDASAMVYRQLGEVLRQQTDAGEVLADSQRLASVMDAAEGDIQAVYQQNEFDPPASGNLNSDEKSRILARASSVSRVVDRLIDRHNPVYSQAEVKGLASLVETVVLKSTRREFSSNDSVENFVALVTDEQSASIRRTLVQALASDEADVSALVDSDISASTATEDVDAAARIPQGAQPFTALAGKRLKVSDLDLGRAPNKLKDSEVELYFRGAADVTSGSFDACVKYIKDASVDGSLGEASTRGERVSGYWSLLGATVDDNRAYNLLLTMRFLGTRYQAIIKSGGTETVDGVEYRRIRFDNNEDLSVWHSKDGLQPTAHVPETSEECEARQPSRIGL